MLTMDIAPYGSWTSPLTSERMIEESIKFQEIHCDGQNLYWIEGRPAEKGRSALVYYALDGKPVDLIPTKSIRTRVHEYGGGALTVFKQQVIFSNAEDQRLYRLRPDGTVEALTPAGEKRFADGVVTPDAKALICVMEDHEKAPVVTNCLVRIDLTAQKEIQILASGHDFYSSPRLSPDGKFLAFVTWDHPDMPWDATKLWVAKIQEDGSLKEQVLIAGTEEESIQQPAWSNEGDLYFVSDRSAFWNLYRYKNQTVEALHPQMAEYGQPPWVFGRPSYAFAKIAGEPVIVCVYTEGGFDRLALLFLKDKRFEVLDLHYTVIRNLSAADGKVFFFGASTTEPTALIELDLVTKKNKVIKTSIKRHLDPTFISTPHPILFPSMDHQEGYAFYYPPKNPHYKAPEGELPPLIVKCHGGPTAQSTAALSLEIQFWTTRGIAVLDVNYGGSSGYGRAYRKRLNGKWGVLDVRDCVNAALFLAKQGLVDQKRLLIEGGSAGGYTTLCALTFFDHFAAGTSFYGVSDLESLVKDTHKFEAHYLDRLVGLYPEKKEIYRQRSPIDHVERISKPILLLQGKEDPVVPPNQAQMIFDALNLKKIPVAMLLFDKEAHGFRMASTIKRCFDAQLYFYSQILGFSLKEPVPAIPIENLTNK
jgi:dipeptidyl aminopeptidase/acylaminoacyl peptidase